MILDTKIDSIQTGERARARARTRQLHANGNTKMGNRNGNRIPNQFEGYPNRRFLSAVSFVCVCVRFGLSSTPRSRLPNSTTTTVAAAAIQLC